jgi:hypothetical protein
MRNTGIKININKFLNNFSGNEAAAATISAALAELVTRQQQQQQHQFSLHTALANIEVKQSRKKFQRMN